jgi:hypothetical protein
MLLNNLFEFDNSNTKTTANVATNNSDTSKKEEPTTATNKTINKDIDDYELRSLDNTINKPVNEDKIYYNVLATTKKQLVEEFGLQRDSQGWYLHKGSSRSQILEAERAFGRKILNNK